MSDKKAKIAVMTSGGDAPGMNAAIRAVVRTAIYNGYQVYGINRGFSGLLEADIREMDARSVAGIIDRGGTILRSARCKEMMTPEGQEKAGNICKALGITALVVIGGDGSITGAHKLAKHGINAIGIPGTIDLDLVCSEYTIGFDTALNTAMEAIQKIRDTAGSHQRCSIVEVMGRNCGELALWSGIATGADEVILPEIGEFSIDELISTIITRRADGKKHNIVVMAEGVGGTTEVAKTIEAKTGIETRATILGHLQRGGSPTAYDRYIASLMGAKAVELIHNNEQNKIVIMKNNKIDSIDIDEGLAMQGQVKIDEERHNVLKALSI